MQSGIWKSVESPQSWPQAQAVSFSAPVQFSRLPSTSSPVSAPAATSVSPASSKGSNWTQSWESSNVFRKAGAKLFGKSRSSKSSEVKSGEVPASVVVPPPAEVEVKKAVAPQVFVSEEFATVQEISSVVDSENPEEDEHIEDELSRQNLYKTELCRSFQDTGICRYGHKCQFAHGYGELRPVMRHPKYKTEICKTFTNTGNCPYGNRCRFIHQANPNKAAVAAAAAANSGNSASSGWSTSWTQPQNEAKPVKKAALINHSVDDLLEGTRRLAVFQQLAN